MTMANVSANKINTIPRQCHPAAIPQMVMDGLRCLLGDATHIWKITTSKARTNADLYFIASFVYAVDKVRTTFVVA